MGCQSAGDLVDLGLYCGDELCLYQDDQLPESDSLTQQAVPE